MRLIASLAVLGIMVSASVPAMAQNNTTTNTNAPVMYAVPMYNSAGSQYYSTAGAAPVYNNAGAQPLPIQQMIAGKNAPSYVSGGQNAYTGFGNASSGSASSLSSEEYYRLNAQRQAAAQKTQAEYMASLQQTQQGQLVQQNPYVQGATNIYSQFTQPQQQQVPTKRRVIYKELNNPLVAPPRLFNPDQ